jgi:hypothetical protein
MKGWIEKTDDRESVDDSELNDLTLTALEMFKKKKIQTSYIPPPSIACQSLVRFLNVLFLRLKNIVVWYGCEFRHERELKGELL